MTNKTTSERVIDTIARVFNRTVLGAWTILALYLGFSGEYLISALMIFVGIPIYFRLEDKYYHKD